MTEVAPEELPTGSAKPADLEPMTEVAPKELPTGSAAPHGYVDAIVRGEVHGWCWRADEPETRLEVEVIIDGTPVASGTADLMRESVAQAGFGDGRYGFKIPIPEALADGTQHTIEVRANQSSLPVSPSFAKAGQQEDPESPWVRTRFVSQMAARPPAVREDGHASRSRRGQKVAEEPEPELRGYVDGILDGAIVGWVVDQARPDVTVSLEAFLDGVYIGSVDADIPREDVARAGFGERHGFRFPLPAELEAGDYMVEVRSTPDGWRVPLVGDYSVLDADRQPIEGIVLKEPRISGQQLSREALLGIDGWMFEWPGPRVFNVLRGAQPMPAAVFDRQRSRLLERRDLTGAAGVILIEAVIPSKLAIYPEFLPAGLSVIDAGRPAEELSANIGEENGIELLDLARPLRQAKRHGLVFSRTGRDLTWLGGFSAYRVIARDLAKRRSEIKPLARNALELGNLEPVPDSLGDLPRLVWIGSRTLPAGPGAHDEEREGEPALRWDQFSAEFTVVPPELARLAGASPALLRTRQPTRDTSALVIHDGSAVKLLPFLAEHFAQVLITAGDADLDQLLEALAPEAVIEAVAERSLLLI